MLYKINCIRTNKFSNLISHFFRWTRNCVVLFNATLVVLLFFIDDFPKPQITVQPETQSAIKGSNLSFICSAASSSDSPMTFAWKKDNELICDAKMENYAHLRAQGGEVMEYTTILRLCNVEFSNEGKYQCVISNHFGSSYSVKAKLTVNSKHLKYTYTLK